MSTTTIATVEDLVRVLDENPGWLEALRVRLLTRELLELPKTMAEFVATTNRRFEEVDRRFEEVDRRFDAVDRRFDRLESDIGPIKAAHARNAAVREADLIAEESGLAFIRTLSDAEIRDLVQSSDTAGISVNDLRSFRLADLILEAHDSSGESCYLAAEISFTANGRDTARAIRNAGLLARFTGRRAHSAVAGLRHDDRIEAGEVAWYELDAHALEMD